MPDTRLRTVTTPRKTEAALRGCPKRSSNEIGIKDPQVTVWFDQSVQE